MVVLKKQIPEYQTYLKLQGGVAPTLIHLFSAGVTNEDMIGMNHLVLEFKNRDFLSNPLLDYKDSKISVHFKIFPLYSIYSLSSIFVAIILI